MDHGIILTCRQLENWAARPLSDEEVDVIAERVASSTIPDAIATIANEVADSSGNAVWALVYCKSCGRTLCDVYGNRLCAKCARTKVKMQISVKRHETVHRQVESATAHGTVRSFTRPVNVRA